jgi:ATP-dependent Lon protease
LSRARAGKNGRERKSVEYPALQLSNSVVFPDDVVSVQLPDEEVAAPLFLLEGKRNAEVVLVFARGDRREIRNLEDLLPIGVLCRVVQRMQMPGGGLQLVFQGLARMHVRELRHDGGIPFVTAVEIGDDTEDSTDTNERIVEVLDLLSEYLPRDGTYPEDLETIFRMNVRGPGRFADLVTAYLHFPLSVKRAVATTLDVQERLGIVVEGLRGELQRFTVESEVHRRVREQMEERQREQYLRHQMRAIRHELGDESSPDEESDELLEKLREAGMPDEARETTEREIKRLRSVSPSSAEYQVIRTYVGWLLDLPWKKRTRDRLDLPRAREILDEDHTGLEKVKERILEHLAVRKLNRSQRGSILCLVGPPGVGKTSLGKAIAQALGRKFVRMSVGGLRDEAEIKGHRRTYVGAMPGKVMQLMKRAGVRNPVLQIDEIDKMGADHRGDPAAAVLEVLDAECNDTFRDHYLDVGYDLTEVFFLVTANLLDTIPAALRDRLEVIHMGGYTHEEKLAISRNHLVPRSIKGTGLRSSQLRFTAAGLSRIIESHTREAGLRELERNILRICRKVAKRYVEGDQTHVRVGKRKVRELLGPERYRSDIAGRRPEVGVATGLAWTAFGGSILTIEANRMPGRGSIDVTGQLGDVMRESAQAALSYVRANCVEFDIDPKVFRRSDIHLHFPEGATPKDGPSAGVAIATCLVSLFTGRAVRHDLAMTGEVTLKGKVLEVGGIKEKLLAAQRAGLRTVLIPKDNLKDLEDVPEEVRRSLDVIGCEEVEQNISEALLDTVVPHDLDVVEHPAPARVARGGKRARSRS